MAGHVDIYCNMMSTNNFDTVSYFEYKPSPQTKTDKKWYEQWLKHKIACCINEIACSINGCSRTKTSVLY